MKKTIGPVQLLAIGFEPNFKFTGKIMKEFEKLEQTGTLRILDLLFVKKEEDNSGIIALDLQGEELGAIVGALMGFEFDSTKSKNVDLSAGNNPFGISVDDIEKLGRSLPPGSAAGIVLVEHMWARDLKTAIRDAGGHPIAEGFLTPEAIASVSMELLALTSEMNKEEDMQKQKTIQVKPTKSSSKYQSAHI